MKAIALINPVLARSPLREWLTKRCESVGLALNIHVIGSSNRNEYPSLFESYSNIISGEFGRTAMSRWKPGKNVLWIANSLINPKAGVFVDGGGYFTESNLHTKKTWNIDHNIDMCSIASAFGWQALGRGTPSGPILVAMQVRDDMSVRHFFPLGKGSGDRAVTFLKLLHDNLPRGRRILIRPHPNEISRSTWSHGGIWRDDWELDTKESIATRLPQCSALVTVNSTCATEAALLAIPTATLGTGAFLESKVTLECWNNPSRLRELLNWQPHQDDCRRYAQAVIGRHYLPYNALQPASAEFDEWLNKALMAVQPSSKTCRQ